MAGLVELIYHYIFMIAPQARFLCILFYFRDKRKAGLRDSMIYDLLHIL